MQRLDLKLLKSHLEKTNPNKYLFKLIKNELSKQGYIIRKRKVKITKEITCCAVCNQPLQVQRAVWEAGKWYCDICLTTVKVKTIKAEMSALNVATNKGLIDMPAEVTEAINSGAEINLDAKTLQAQTSTIQGILNP